MCAMSSHNTYSNELLASDEATPLGIGTLVKTLNILLKRIYPFLNQVPAQLKQFPLIRSKIRVQSVMWQCIIGPSARM